MRVDQYQICGNCVQFCSMDRYHGYCRIYSEIARNGGSEEMVQKRVRWNTDARNCLSFSGTIGGGHL